MFRAPTRSKKERRPREAAVSFRSVQPRSVARGAAEVAAALAVRAALVAALGPAVAVRVRRVVRALLRLHLVVHRVPGLLQFLLRLPATLVPVVQHAARGLATAEAEREAD